MERLDKLFDKRSVVGAKLSLILDEQGYTKAEICKQAGISRPTFDKLLAGTLTSKTNYAKHIEKILICLALTPDMLLGNVSDCRNEMRAIRNKRGMTMEQLAQLTGISKEQLQKMERGESEKEEELREVALFLGVSTNILSGRYFFAPQIAMPDFVLKHRGETDGCSGFWGHVGILAENTEKYLWYPITADTRDMIYERMKGRYLLIPCMNNKVLLLCMDHVKKIMLLDDDCDTPSEENWDEEIDCGEIPLAAYEALNDYEENNEASGESGESGESEESEASGVSRVNRENSENRENRENSENRDKGVSGEHGQFRRMSGYLKQLIRENRWSEEQIRKILNETSIYYADGQKETAYIDFCTSQALNDMVVMLYDFWEDPDIGEICPFTEWGGAEHLLNMKQVSLLELPLLELENAICDFLEEEREDG